MPLRSCRDFFRWLAVACACCASHAYAFDAGACLASDARARQAAASDGAMVAELQGSLGETAVPDSVRRIFERLISASHAGVPSDFKLLGYRGPTFTAHAAAPGIVLVSDKVWSGRIDESDVAAVLAHEIGHLRLHHSRIAGCKALKFVDADAWNVGDAVQAVLRVAKTEPIVAQAWGAMLRKFEFEADAAALPILREAGYDPHVLPRLLSRLAQQADSAPVLPLAAGGSHPALRDRIAAIELVLQSR